MLHDVESVGRERQRVAERPAADSAPPVLALFEATVAVPADAYAGRLRAVLDPALGVALTESFDEESLPDGAIPEWFRTVGEDGEDGGAAAPEFARDGRARYRTEVEEGNWNIQDWLFQFDPGSEFRGWAWWDATRIGENLVRVWVDSWGESFFGCDELRWLLFTAGAQSVSGPRVVKAAEWIGETTV